MVLICPVLVPFLVLVQDSLCVGNKRSKNVVGVMLSDDTRKLLRTFLGPTPPSSPTKKRIDKEENNNVVKGSKSITTQLGGDLIT